MSSGMPYELQERIMSNMFQRLSITSPKYRTLVVVKKGSYRWCALKPTFCHLRSDSDIHDLIQQSEDFHSCMSVRYPRFQFANLQILDICIPSTQDLTVSLSKALKHLKIRELIVNRAGNDNLIHVLQILAPALADLQRLGIRYDDGNADETNTCPWTLPPWPHAISRFDTLKVISLTIPFTEAKRQGLVKDVESILPLWTSFFTSTDLIYLISSQNLDSNPGRGYRCFQDIYRSTLDGSLIHTQRSYEATTIEDSESDSDDDESAYHWVCEQMDDLVEVEYIVSARLLSPRKKEGSAGIVDILESDSEAYETGGLSDEVEE